MEKNERQFDFELPLPNRDTFKGADSETKLMYLFDMNCVALDNQAKVISFIKDGRRQDRKINLTLSSGMGAAAAAAAIALKEIVAFLRH